MRNIVRVSVFYIHIPAYFMVQPTNIRAVNSEINYFAIPAMGTLENTNLAQNSLWRCKALQQFLCPCFYFRKFATEAIRNADTVFHRDMRIVFQFNDIVRVQQRPSIRNNIFRFFRSQFDVDRCIIIRCCFGQFGHKGCFFNNIRHGFYRFVPVFEAHRPVIDVNICQRLSGVFSRLIRILIDVVIHNTALIQGFGNQIPVCPGGKYDDFPARLTKLLHSIYGAGQRITEDFFAFPVIIR